MSQLNSFLDHLIADPEIRALLDQAQAQSFPQPSAGGVFSSRIDPALLASEPGAFGGPLDPTTSTIAEKTDLLSRGIGTDRFGLEFARGFDANPAADLGPRPFIREVPGPSAFDLGANAPATSLPTNLRQGFGPSAGGQPGFLSQEGAGQIDAQRRQQFAEQAALAEQQSPVNQTIQQLADAFGGVNRIPPIGSSFIGSEGLEGAIPGSQSVYGVTAGPFTIARFGSQQEADAARDALRGALRQGPAPPPALLSQGGVLSPFGRTGAQQFDDQRALSQEQRLAFNALQDAGFNIGLPGRGGARGGRAGGGGRPFQVVQQAVKLGPGQGFAMIEAAQRLRLPDQRDAEGLTVEQQNLFELFSGGRRVSSLERAMNLAGDKDMIGDLLDEGVLDTDEAIIAEVMRRRLSRVRLGTENADTVTQAVKRLGDRPLGRQEAENALNALGLDRRDSELVGIQDAAAAVRFDAAQRQRRASQTLRGGGREETRFQERETPADRVVRQGRERDERVQVRREDVALKRQQTLEDRATREQARLTAAGDRTRASQIQLRIRPILREIGGLQATLRSERARRPAVGNRALELTERGIDLGGPDPAAIQSFLDQIESLQDEFEALVTELGA